MDELQKERIVKNEALFRDVNERVRELDAELSEPGEDDQLSEFLCECGDSECFDRVRLTNPEYEQVRAVATHFLVVPGHVIPEVEVVVSENERFAVVEKRPGTDAIARETDPRA